MPLSSSWCLFYNCTTAIAAGCRQPFSHDDCPFYPRPVLGRLSSAIVTPSSYYTSLFLLVLDSLSAHLLLFLPLFLFFLYLERAIFLGGAAIVHGEDDTISKILRARRSAVVLLVVTTTGTREGARSPDQPAAHGARQ
jgi:hypothetical protein